MSIYDTGANELAEAIERATENAVRELFADYPGHYYYIALITTGEAHAPCLSAWSIEALEIAVRATADWNSNRRKLKWSYADSPYCAFGERHFAEVKALFLSRLEVNAFDNVEYELRLAAMETAMRRLDSKGLFGVEEARLKTVINVEVIPPDSSNTERALRLNPPEAIREWLSEAAEY